MWPFSSSDSSASSSSSSSPSTPPPPFLHPTENRPLTTSESANPKLNPLNPEGHKPCCACPDTKKLRDDCFLKFGSNADDGSDSQDKCRQIVEDHKKCMRSLGFNV
ncbi:copper metallochaperone COX17 [Sporobolomyces salmoneus]|uniref:copper metallochaperone COX17 n=1 Tax=Sporobolomyces salmoneus TaxID=183962 RepID=UPI00316CEB84